MSTSPIRVVASVVAVAILAFPAVPALPDPAPAPTAEAPVPSTEAPLSAPSAEKAAPAPVTESPTAAPEAEVPAPPSAAETLPLFKAEQLDQLLAPIALYPDALLAQILMAATYPLEIVKADRWLQDPAHANSQGDQLAAAIEAEAWDPSVKSLVPFPRILRMMDGALDWTEQLGNAVMAQQGDVMDSIQRLRHQAAASGTLWSNAEQRVTTERQGIVIEPVNPEFIYPPVYSPAVYGPWPYPDYPPLDISSPDYGFGFSLPFGIGFGVGFAVVQPLWRWCAFDWGQRRIQLDIEKFNTLNHHRAGLGTDTWRHDPGHLPSALNNDHASRTRFRSTISAAAIPRMNVPSAGAPAQTAVSRSASSALAGSGPLPTAVLRSPAPGFAPSWQGPQAPLKTQSGLAGPRIVAPSKMPPGFPRLMLPGTAARSTASAPGSRAPVEGVSRR
jgi:Protein of unknown function (DUF3300)